MTIASYNLENEESYLKSYLEKATAECSKDNGQNRNCGGNDSDDLTAQRVFCCGTSRSLYCPECCKVLVPRECWPRSFISQQQQKFGSGFPFQFMDIVLGVKERRTSSTGIQLMCISNMISEAAEESTKSSVNQPVEIEDEAAASYNREKGDCVAEEHAWWDNIKLYDLNRGDTLPQYGPGDATPEKYEEGTYVLFPQEGKSVPISTVAHKIKRLVVLDIKWSRSYNVQLFSADHHKILVSTPGEGGAGKSYNPLAPLKDLPFVHLEYPPQNSNFWRWHNRGAGMLSTLEAIYFAAREASVALQQQHDIGESVEGTDCCSSGPQDSAEEPDNDKSFIDILWLFALQRSIIQKKSIEEGRPVAFSEEAKAMARALRKQGPSKTD